MHKILSLFFLAFALNAHQNQFMMPMDHANMHMQMTNKMMTDMRPKFDDHFAAHHDMMNKNMGQMNRGFQNDFDTQMNGGFKIMHDQMSDMNSNLKDQMSGMNHVMKGQMNGMNDMMKNHMEGMQQMMNPIDQKLMNHMRTGSKILKPEMKSESEFGFKFSAAIVSCVTLALMY